jgi:4-hydroxy-tetrahydrodipicolinate reductase
MIILLLGHGKTGSIVAEVARERGHEIRVLRSSDNADAGALTLDCLKDADVVIDFTNSHAVIANIGACVRFRKNMVVGTTGWHNELPRIRELVEATGTGFVYGSNFSVGVNLFLEVAHTSAAALKHGYFGQIFERHHVHKKDAPSGTALSLQTIIQQAGGAQVEITSFREGEVVGMHELVYESDDDDIYLCHDAKSRRGFAQGAVRAAEWIRGKNGVYDFKDIWRQL